MNVLAIAGSLRAASINAACCRAAARLPPAEFHVTVLAGLGGLPHFNPDLDETPPQSVLDLRHQVARADALLVASPEFALGVCGVLKNALDWHVRFEGFVHKPVAGLQPAALASGLDPMTPSDGKRALGRYAASCCLLARGKGVLPHRAPWLEPLAREGVRTCSRNTSEATS